MIVSGRARMCVVVIGITLPGHLRVEEKKIQPFRAGILSGRVVVIGSNSSRPALGQVVITID